MTGSGVERMPRTAYPLPFPPAGASTPLPPHIQGAERQSERRARRTGLRWSVRVLVVGGLAGAAWLLTGSAAHAADRADGPDGSLLGSLVGGEATAPITGLLQAAVQPLEDAEPAAHQHRAADDILDVPRRVLTRTSDTFDEVMRGVDRDTVDVLDVDRVLRDVAAPHRLTGGSARVHPRLTVVTDTYTDTGTETEQPAAEQPAAERPQQPVVERPQQPADEPVAAPSSDPAPVMAASRTLIPAFPVSAPVAGPRAVAQVKHGKATSGSSAHRHHRALPQRKTHATVHHAVRAEPATVQEDSTPGGDGPAAPLRLHLGDVSGTPTSASGTATDGGCAAFLPAAIANSTMACHRLALASDVEARRHDAEAPTVSPD